MRADTSKKDDTMTDTTCEALDALVAKMNGLIDEVESDIAQDAADAEHTGERTDLWDYGVTLDPQEVRELTDAITAITAITSLRAEAEDAHAACMHMGDMLAARDAEIAGLRGALERDRTTVIETVNAVRSEISGREWLLTGRGPYEWDDDRYRAEFAAALEAIRQPIEVLRKIGGDWSNCPKDQAAVDAARADWKARADRAEADLARLTAERDAERALVAGAFEARRESLTWIIENTTQARVRDLALDILQGATPAAARDALASIERRAEARGMREAADVKIDIDGIGPSGLPSRWRGTILAAADRKEQGHD